MKVDYVRGSMLAELRSALKVNVRDASPRRVHAKAILGVRRRPVEEDEEEEPPVEPIVLRIRSRSPSNDGDRRRHY